MLAPVALRNQYSDLFGTGMLPVLEEMFLSELMRHPSRRDQLFKVVPWDRDIWQASELGDLPLFEEIAEGTEYTFKRPAQGPSKTFTMTKYGLGFSISEEMVDDGKFDLIGDLVRKLAKSGRESQEVAAMSVFNNAFTTNLSSDGLSVINSAHTLPSGLTYSNSLTVAADLSPASLDAALAQFEQAYIGDSGIIYNMKPKYLLVAPENKRYAMEIVGSTLKADTADNNMNSFLQDNLIVVSSPYLTDKDAWFLISDAPETGLRIIERKPLETKAAGNDVGFGTDTIAYKARFREAIGVTHPRGIFGSPGV